ncbi:hypothetical protein FGB62_112g13 [Gracilaria domingensis]|nr:hypothetical protein FGB62_112g13 [Gracilaria domingensis]
MRTVCRSDEASWKHRLKRPTQRSRHKGCRCAGAWNGLVAVSGKVAVSCGMALGINDAHAYDMVIRASECSARLLTFAVSRWAHGGPSRSPIDVAAKWHAFSTNPARNASAKPSPPLLPTPTR